MHDATRESSVGRIVLALAIGAFGVENLVIGDFLPELQRAPAWLPARAACAYATGAVLVTAAGCVLANHGVRAAARVIAGVAALWIITGHAPMLLVAPRNGGAWTTAAEVIAIAGAALQLGFPTAPAPGRVVFALTLPVFGALHFIYADYVAAVIPAWIPAHGFWAYATGGAHLAAGVSLIVGIRARLAAHLLAAMFGGWVILLHVPRALSAADQLAEWTSLCVAVAMLGGSVISAAGLPATGRATSAGARRRAATMG